MDLSRKTKKVIIGFFMLAMFVNIVLSSYIYYAKILGEKGLGSGSSCFANDGALGECLKVQLSSYSTILGIPLSIYGAVFFLIIFLILLMIFMEHESNWIGKTAKKYITHTRISLLIGFIWGGAFSLWLIYLQFFVIKELCFFCLWIDGITLGSAIVFLWLFSKQAFD